MANYSSYNQCPNCRKTESGFSIHQCINCGFIGCFQGGGVFSSNSGCFSKSYCPSCRESKGTKQLGRIY
jgi:ssDNA-binding Zn-finger/Zn-ribbon topoisomerase 1